MRSFYVVFSVLFESRLKVSHGYQFLGLLADWFARAGMDDLSHVREGLHPVSLGPLRFLDGREHDFLRREGERGDPFFPCVPGDLLAGRVAFLRDSSAAAFVECLHALEGEIFRMGQSSFRLEKPLFNGTTPGMAPPGCARPEDVLAECRKKQGNLLAFRFFTPTGFKKNEAQYVLPLPSLVFGSLLRRWRSWIDEKTWENLQGREEELFEKIIISGVNIASKPVRLKNKSVCRGFVGSVHYDIHRCNAEEKHLLHTLGVFASYGGVGYKTSQGMGETALYKS